ncbi:MAG: leucine-rich repeat domain-containing protein, partial [Lachnospiraceae bacterium]|nr:leucine-rich repeat domain-containing protein [Lachnospiraceae bacterium]
AGTYRGTATIAETDNYQGATTTTAEFTISKVDSVAATVNANNRTYDGTDQPLVTVTGETKGGEMQYALGTATEATQPYTTSIPTATNAGTYKVWYMVKGNPNYYDTAPGALTVSIGKGEYSGVKTLPEYVHIGEAVTNTLELPAVPEGAAYDTNITISGNSAGLISSATVSGNSLTYSTAALNERTTASIIIPVRDAVNYKDYDFTIIISTKNDAVVTLGSEDALIKTYGDDEFTIGATVENEGAGGEWTYTSSDTDVAVISDAGTVTITGAGDTVLTAVYNSDTTMGQASVSLKVNKAAPEYNAPQPQILLCNATLADISLPEHFSLEDGNAALQLGANTVKVKYTPEDTDNYKDVSGIEVQVILQHKLEETEAVTATQTNPGNSAYWTCSVCGKHFSDKEGKTEIEDGSWIVQMLPKTEPTTDPKTDNPGVDDPGNKNTDGNDPGKVTQNEVPADKGTTITQSGEDAAEYVVISDKGETPAAAFVKPCNEADKNITIPDTVTKGNVTYEVVKIDVNAFKGDKSVENVKVGNNIKEISDNAFSGCVNLKSVDLSKANIEIIGKNAFKGTKLKTVTLPDTVKTVKAGAFSNCKNMTSITFGKNTKTIGKNVVKNSGKLKTIIIRSDKVLSAKNLKALVKSLKNKKVTIKVKKSLFAKYKSAMKKAGFRGKLKKFK